MFQFMFDIDRPSIEVDADRINEENDCVFAYKNDYIVAIIPKFNLLCAMYIGEQKSVGGEVASVGEAACGYISPEPTKNITINL